MDAEYARLASTILALSRRSPNARLLVAIAGIPGSGKTTTAEAVVKHLTSPSSSTNAVLLSMDGFHLPRSTLDTLPNREEAYTRRGAPWTFDVHRFVEFIRELRAWANSTTCSASPTPSPSTSTSCKAQIFYAPTFSHVSKDPVENGLAIPPSTSIVIIEGNYLLLDEPEWREIARMVDFRVFVDAELQEARERVAKRHVAAGIEKTLEDGFRRVDRNDYLNALMVREKLIRPDVVVRSVREQLSLNGV